VQKKFSSQIKSFIVLTRNYFGRLSSKRKCVQRSALLFALFVGGRGDVIFKMKCRSRHQHHEESESVLQRRLIIDASRPTAA